ncbi:MAG: dipicolinate synthase subunit B [Oscillospiraceae bacterium]|nr:dipicolinate synthase subunit B [Oscillospiraceae bacterium]
MIHEDTRVGFALTGSFCTFERILIVMRRFAETGVQLQPILSYAANEANTRFMRASDLRAQLKEITKREPWHTIQQVEPIGPGKLLDLLVIAPCTGNTLAKLANGIADTPTLLAAKSALRNEKPVVIAISTNDGLAAAAQNIGRLLARKFIYFVPFGQDDPKGKPTSIVANMELIPTVVDDALDGRQTQPILLGVPDMKAAD